MHGPLVVMHVSAALAALSTGLFVVLWRLATPRIAGTIGARRGRINDDLAEAQKHRGDAEAASAAYQTALAGARARATTRGAQR